MTPAQYFFSLSSKNQMINKRRNLFHDIIGDFLDRTLQLRFDICRCPRCREMMLKAAAEKFPPIYVEAEHSAYQDTISRFSGKYIGRIMEEVSYAIATVSENPPHAVEDDKEYWFKQLLERIHQGRGLDFSQYHTNFIKRRVAIRMRSLKLDSYVDYLKLLAAQPQEFERLFEVLTINVSEFFRDLGVWAEIHSLLKRLYAAHEGKSLPLKIWCAGCAHGEEPYSYAIMIKELGNPHPVEITATDVDPDAILTAQKGEYDRGRVKNVSKELLSKYFIPIEGGKFAIKDEIKKMVIFKRHDLIKEPGLPAINLISCRNVFIYFTKALQEQILNKFYDSLITGGYLMIGKSETIITEAKLIFEEIDMVSRIYRKSAFSQ